MPRNLRAFCTAAILILSINVPVWGQSQKPPIHITVDLSDVPRKLFHAEIDLPVTAGPVTLITPKWIPGDHRPTGPVDGITGVATPSLLEGSSRRAPTRSCRWRQ